MTMKTNILSFQKNISKVLPNKKAQTISEVFFLFLLGMLAVTLHAKLRIPMHLPGKQGILFMFILISGRLISSFKYPSMISAFGASSLLLLNVLGFGDPFLAGIYLLLGFSVDFFLNISKSLNSKAIFIGFISGISYMIIPITRFLMSSISGFYYNSFSSGIAFPVFTHFCFGFIGGLIASIMFYSLSKKKE